jgi:aryl-alcohol dehydrogenase-like predicted oxidoreductase
MKRASEHTETRLHNSTLPADRRTFLNAAVAAVAGLAWPQHLTAEETGPGSDRFGPLLPTRPFGKTGERITIMGIGGQHFRRLKENDLEPAIGQAIAGGVRFFDTASMYGSDQLSERLYGKYLTPKYRDHIYLMTKSHARDADDARMHLDLSLKHMKTEVIDLWQVHTLETIEDVDQRWNSGAVDVFLKAREEGKVRHVGITGHKAPDVMLHAIRQFTERGIPLEAVQMPVNVCDPAYASFIENVIPVCLERDIAILAMKTMCGGRLFGGRGEGWGPRGQVDTAPVVPDFMPFRDATDYVWSLPIASRIAGFDTIGQLRENIEAARTAGKLSAERQKAILALAAEHGGPKREYYKRKLNPGDNEREKNF